MDVVTKDDRLPFKLTPETMMTNFGVWGRLALRTALPVRASDSSWNMSSYGLGKR